MLEILNGEKMISQLKLVFDVTAFLLIYLGGILAFNIDKVNALTIVGASAAGGPNWPIGASLAFAVPGVQRAEALAR